MGGNYVPAERVFRMHLNRTMCDVLSEMRKCVETNNFSYLLGLIEEAQSMGNKMEARLYDFKDLKSLKEDIKEYEEERDELRDEISKLKKEKNKLED